MYIMAKKPDGEILYFRDKESKEDYELIHEEELEDAGFTFDIPYYAEVIDNNNYRSNLELRFKFAGINTEDLTDEQLYGLETEDKKFEDTEKRLKEYMDMAQTTYKYENSSLVKQAYNATEVELRKDIAFKNKAFRFFIKSLEDNELAVIKQIFKDNGYDYDKLEDYFEEYLNINLDVLLDKSGTDEEYQARVDAYEKTEEYKKYQKFYDMIGSCYDAIRKYLAKN